MRPGKEKLRSGTGTRQALHRVSGWLPFSRTPVGPGTDHRLSAQGFLAMIHDTILGTIGNTPIIRINHLAPEHVTMYVKCEAFNPMSSVKDRLAFAIINDAEQ